MDKISSIIPTSPRVQAVDLRESSVRPGTPGFGRAEGVSSLNKATANLAQAAAKAEVAVEDAVTSWKSKDMKSAAVAAEMTKNFFSKPTPPPAPAAPAAMEQMPAMKTMSAPAGLFTDRESVPTGFKADGPNAFKMSSMSRMPSYEASEMEMPALQQPEGLFPKGSFLDRSA